MSGKPTVWQLKKRRRQAWRKLKLAESNLEESRLHLARIQAQCRLKLAELHQERVQISSDLDKVFELENRIIETGVFWELHEIETRLKLLRRRLRKVSVRIERLNLLLRKAHRKVRDSRRLVGRARQSYQFAKCQVWRATAHNFAPIVPWSKKLQLARSIRVPSQYHNNLHVVICLNAIHVYFGGENFPTDKGHGHYVIEEGFVTYRRDPYVPHGEGRLEAEWELRERDCQ